MAFDFSQPAYENFRSLAAERTSAIVAWVGSGLSAPAGLPTWPGLRRRLFDAAEKKVNSFDPDEDINQLQRFKRLMEHAESEPNHWIAFELFKKVLGMTSYRESIRSALNPAVTGEIPDGYMNLWKLRLSGLINLNLDRLATRAYTGSRPGKALQEFSGCETANWLHALKTTHPFIVNMHGILDDASSWVITKSELQSLFNTPAYDEFIVSCLSTRTILFLGIGVDDVAVGGHLERMARNSVDIGTHYWLTDRRDITTDRWAEKVGVSIIRYDSTGNDHSAVREFFDNILTFIPADDTPAPVAFRLPSENSLPTPKELRREDAETIRYFLNARASQILQTDTEEEYREYEQFCREYDEAVYRAWYVDLAGGENELLGYRLSERAGGGAFGNVYRATSSDGETVAVKILHEEVRKRPEMLQSFRRGVRSMKILSKAGLNGIVRYRAASEIPAFVVMDWVDGPNLREAIQARKIESWREILTVAHSLTKIVRSAHMLPDRVLHRDLRPANIMLKDYWADPNELNIVVLDFDLSYHVGAREKTIDLRGESATGYLAPEQLQRVQGISTRNSAVDSFGLGMTLYYLVSHRDPLQAQHMHADWRSMVTNACRTRSCDQWLSLPERVSRIILQCTANSQSERWDLAQVESELSRLEQILRFQHRPPSAELVAEELLARSYEASRCVWLDDQLTAQVELASGLVVSISGKEASQDIDLRFSWSSREVRWTKAQGKWLTDGMTSSCNVLASNGWRIGIRSTSDLTAHLDATIAVETVMKNLRRAASTIAKAAQCLTPQ
jgi:serine/threonine protein kinase